MGEYLRACTALGVEPRAALVAALEAAGAVQCTLPRNEPPLTDKGMEAVMAGLTGRQVATLELEGNALSWKSAKSIARVIEGSSETIEVLRLGDNVLEDTGCATIAAAAAGAAKLTTLDLRANTLTGLGAMSLCELLGASLSLRSLVLPRNQIDDAGCGRLAKGLAAASSLTALNLRFNDIGDAGVEALAGVLATSNLLSLDVGGNRIGPVGARLLAEATGREGTALRKLNVRSNQIGADGTRGFAAALRCEYTQLQEVYLGCNGATETAVADVLDAVGGNRMLRKLDLQGCPLSSTHEPRVAELLRRNRTLTQLIVDLAGDAGAHSGRVIAVALLANTTLRDLSLGSAVVIANDSTKPPSSQGSDAAAASASHAAGALMRHMLQGNQILVQLRMLHQAAGDDAAAGGPAALAQRFLQERVALGDGLAEAWDGKYAAAEAELLFQYHTLHKLIPGARDEAEAAAAAAAPTGRTLQLPAVSPCPSPLLDAAQPPGEGSGSGARALTFESQRAEAEVVAATTTSAAAAAALDAATNSPSLVGYLECADDELPPPAAAGGSATGAALDSEPVERAPPPYHDTAAQRSPSEITIPMTLPASSVPRAGPRGGEVEFDTTAAAAPPPPRAPVVPAPSAARPLDITATVGGLLTGVGAGVATPATAGGVPVVSAHSEEREGTLEPSAVADRRGTGGGVTATPSSSATMTTTTTTAMAAAVQHEVHHHTNTRTHALNASTLSATLNSTGASGAYDSRLDEPALISADLLGEDTPSVTGEGSARRAAPAAVPPAVLPPRPRAAAGATLRAPPAGVSAVSVSSEAMKSVGEKTAALKQMIAASLRGGSPARQAQVQAQQPLPTTPTSRLHALLDATTPGGSGGRYSSPRSRASASPGGGGGSPAEVYRREVMQALASRQIARELADERVRQAASVSASPLPIAVGTAFSPPAPVPRPAGGSTPSRIATSPRDVIRTPPAAIAHAQQQQQQRTVVSPVDTNTPGNGGAAVSSAARRQLFAAVPPPGTSRVDLYNERYARSPGSAAGGGGGSAGRGVVSVIHTSAAAGGGGGGGDSPRDRERERERERDRRRDHEREREAQRMWQAVATVKNQVAGIEESLKPQLSDMADIIEALQQQNAALLAKQDATEKKLEGIMEVLEQSLDLRAGEALRDQSALALDTAEEARRLVREQAARLVDMDAMDERVGAVELAVAEVADRVGPALARQDDALQDLSTQLATAREEQEVIGVAAEKAVRFVQQQTDTLQGKVSGLSGEVADVKEVIEMLSSGQDKFTEELQAMGVAAAEKLDTVRRRVEMVEADSAQQLQTQSSQRVQLDAIAASLRAMEEQAAADRGATASAVEAVEGEVVLLKGALSNVRTVESQVSSVTAKQQKMVADYKDFASRMLSVEVGLDKQSTLLKSLQQPTEDAQHKAAQAAKDSRKALHTTEKLTHSVNNITAEWCEGLSALKPKIEELRAASDTHQDTITRVAKLERRLEAVDSQGAAAQDMKESARIIIQQQEMIMGRLTALTSEVTESKAAIARLQNEFATMENNDAAAQDVVEDLRAQLRDVGVRVGAAETAVRRVVADDGAPAAQAAAARLRATGDELTEAATQREELARELALLRKETSEAHLLTGVLRQKLHERSASSPAASTRRSRSASATPGAPAADAKAVTAAVAAMFPGGGGSALTDDGALSHLVSRIDLLEEVLKRDQKASLIALEAILAERGPGLLPGIGAALGAGVKVGGGVAETPSGAGGGTSRPSTPTSAAAHWRAPPPPPAASYDDTPAAGTTPWRQRQAPAPHPRRGAGGPGQVVLEHASPQPARAPGPPPPQAMPAKHQIVFQPTTPTRRGGQGRGS